MKVVVGTIILFSNFTQCTYLPAKSGRLPDADAPFIRARGAFGAPLTHWITPNGRIKSGLGTT